MCVCICMCLCGCGCQYNYSPVPICRGGITGGGNGIFHGHIVVGRGGNSWEGWENGTRIAQKYPKYIRILEPSQNRILGRGTISNQVANSQKSGVGGGLQLGMRE